MNKTYLLRRYGSRHFCTPTLTVYYAITISLNIPANNLRNFEGFCVQIRGFEL